MAVNAGSVYVDLGARLDRREFEAYDRELKKVRERVARREQFKAQLGGDFDPRAFNAYEREIRKSHKATEDMVNATGRFRTAFGTVWGRGGAALAAFGSIDLVKRGIESITSAYADSQVSQQKMATQLKALNISYQEHAKQIDEVIQRTSKLAGLDDEDLQDAFTNIVRATGKVNESLKLTGLAADLARAKHIDVAKAGQLLGRVATGNVTALSRYGVTIDKSATSTEALAAVQRKFGGQAAAYGRTQAGASDRVSVAWENLRETLGQKLSPALTRAMNGVARFVNQMQDGTGAGGKFIDMLQRAGRNFQLFGRHVQDDIHMISGWVTSAEGATSTALHWTGVLVGGSAGRKLKQWGDSVDANRQTIDRWRQEMTIKREVDKIDSDLDRLRNKTSGTLHGILTATHRNMAEIRKTMGTESARGQEAIHDNFQAAVTAIRRAMRNGEISTKTGLAQIRRDMLQELKSLGIASAERGGLPLSKNPPKGDLPVTTSSAGVTKYGGGWIGMPGMVGPDVVPAMLAPGEAVLNRHQQAVIEGMLGDGFLDRLFATVQRPHYMDRGGRIPFAVGGVTPAISSLINELDSKGFHHGSTTTGRHAPSSYHYRGMAVDYGDASNDMQRLWSIVFPQRARFAELFGPTRVNPGPHLMHNGAAFQDAALQADHQDHIHMALAAGIGALGGGSAAALGAVWKALRAPQVGGSGALRDIVQGTLDRTTRLANQRGRSLARTVAGPDLGGGPGGGSNSANKALGRQMAAAMGWTGPQFAALDRLWTGESGWSNTARNASSGAFGIPQALPASKMGPAGAGGNPRAQIAWGLNYIKERYGSPAAAYSAWLSRSPHWYAKGGHAGKAPRPSSSTRRAVERESHWLQAMWARIAPDYGLPAGTPLAGLFQHIRFSKDNMFVGVSSDPSAKGHETDDLLWPRWIWQSSKGQRALDNKTKQKLFIHEMAHRFQSHAATPSTWESEGGAEAFARIVMNRDFGGYRRDPHDPYNAFVRRVLKSRPSQWIMNTQFGRSLGGFVNFAKGGKAGKLPKLVGKATAGLIRKTPATTVDNSDTFNAIMGRVDAIDADYQRHERRFNITDEELVDADTGQLNTPAIQRKIKELTYLALDRRTQEQELETARGFVRNLIRAYRRIVTALRRSLRHAAKKDRSGIRSYISTYDKRIGEWRGKLGELGDQAFDTHTDLLEVQNELADVKATAPNIPTPDAPDTTDTGGDTGGADTGGGGDAVVDTPTPPTAADIAAGVIQQLQTFQQGRVDLLSQFAPNFVSQRQAYMPGGAFSGSPDALTAAGGVRFFGAGGNGSLGGAGGSTVIANFASAPPDPPSFVQQVRFQIENGSSG